MCARRHTGTPPPLCLDPTSPPGLPPDALALAATSGRSARRAAFGWRALCIDRHVPTAARTERSCAAAAPPAAQLAAPCAAPLVLRRPLRAGSVRRGLALGRLLWRARPRPRRCALGRLCVGPPVRWAACALVWRRSAVLWARPAGSRTRNRAPAGHACGVAQHGEARTRRSRAAGDGCEGRAPVHQGHPPAPNRVSLSDMPCGGRAVRGAVPRRASLPCKCFAA